VALSRATFSTIVRRLCRWSNAWTTAAVVQSLLQRPGLRTIVLNVARENAAALRCYQRLGFWPFCGYHEGVGRLGPASYSPQESRVP